MFFFISLAFFRVRSFGSSLFPQDLSRSLPCTHEPPLVYKKKGESLLVLLDEASKMTTSFQGDRYAKKMHTRRPYSLFFLHPAL